MTHWLRRYAEWLHLRWPAGMVEPLPRLGENGATNVPGLRVAGDLAGVPLLKLALDSAARAVRAMAAVTWEERPYRRGEVAGYRLVVATGLPAANAAVYEDGEEAGVWVNSADDPDHCSATLPAILRRGSLMVTVSTGGRSPAAASWLKARLAAEVGPEYEVLVDLLAAEREAVRADGRSTEGLNWQKALDSDMLELIKNGQVADARERLQACLSSSSD